MVDIDELLSVIENPARRKILEALVREPHYPLQLSKELGMSQQAVMKHLKVLRNYNLVQSYPEESDLGGPMRRRYYPALNFTITVDFGPNLFSTELVSRNLLGEGQREKEVEGEDLAHFEVRAKKLRKDMAEIDAQLEDLRRRRDQLIERKERALEEVGRLMEHMEDYQLRKIMYEFISRPDLDLEEIARQLSLRDEVVRRTLKDLLEG